MIRTLEIEDVVKELQKNCDDRIYFAHYTRGNEYVFEYINAEDDLAKLFLEEHFIDEEMFEHSDYSDCVVEFNIDEYIIFGESRFATEFINDVLERLHEGESESDSE